MSRSDLADIQVIYQTSTERAVCVRETEDSPGGQRRSGSGAHCKGVATGKRLQGPGGMYGGPRTAPEPQKEETENDDE